MVAFMFSAVRAVDGGLAREDWDMTFSWEMPSTSSIASSRRIQLDAQVRPSDSRPRRVVPSLRDSGSLLRLPRTYVRDYFLSSLRDLVQIRSGKDTACT